VIDLPEPEGGVMYCPHCGEGSTFGLKYCKRCGEAINLTNEAVLAAQPSSRITSAAWAIALATIAITLGGIGIVFGFVTDFLRPLPWGQQPHGDATMIAVLMLVCGSVTIFGSAALLIRLFSKLLLSSDQRERRGWKSNKDAEAIVAPPQIQPPILSAPNVTEHTTRNFEQHYHQPVAPR